MTPPADTAPRTCRFICVEYRRRHYWLSEAGIRFAWLGERTASNYPLGAVLHVTDMVILPPKTGHAV